MALVKRADTETLARSALVLDLGDLRRQADELERRTREQCELLIADARAERQRILAGASEHGYADGFAKGLAAGVEEGRRRGHDEAVAAAVDGCKAVQSGWEAALVDFVARRDDMLTQAKNEVLMLALEIARRVLKRVVETRPGVAADQLEAALSMVMRPSTLVVEVHPEDEAIMSVMMPRVGERLSASAHAVLRTRDDLSRGSVILRSEGGEVDASIDTQVRRIIAEIVPEQLRDRALAASAERSEAAEAGHDPRPAPEGTA